MDPLVSLFDPGDADSDMPESLPPEVEEGNVEYKLKLVSPSQGRFEHLVTQMKWRLQEGQGEAIYEIGVEDNGMLAGLTDIELNASLNTLSRMAAELGADISILREKQVESNEGEHRKRVAEVLVRKVPENQQFIDLRLAVLGNVDAGKSTLLGVLTQGELDNGRGKARLNLFRHLHEIQSGRTSSISNEILGFNSKGEVVNYSESRTAEEICENSTKLITLIDLCGHHKYLKTTIFGLTGYSPDFAMLVVSANTGIVGTTKEHLGFALALGVPIFVVVSKIDMCRSSQVEKTIRQLEKILKNPGCRKVPFRVDTEDDAVTAASTFHNDRWYRVGKKLSSPAVQAELANMELTRRVSQLTLAKSSSDSPPKRRIPRPSSYRSNLYLAYETVPEEPAIPIATNSWNRPVVPIVNPDPPRCESDPGAVDRTIGEMQTTRPTYTEPLCAVTRPSTSSHPPRRRQSVCDNSIAPIFTVSCVSGKNMKLLTKFLNVLPPLQNCKEREKYVQELSEHQIDEVYHIPGVGAVLAGTVLRGMIREGDKMVVGPTDSGEFHPVTVGTIHRNRLPCRIATAGQTASLSVGESDKFSVRKGMVLVSPKLQPMACIEFEADICVLFHNNYICKGFQTVIHVGNVCQTAKIIKMSKSGIQTNQKAVVVFRFINRPEYIRVGSRLIFREGRTKGMGEVTKLFPYEDIAR